MTPGRGPLETCIRLCFSGTALYPWRLLKATLNSFGNNGHRKTEQARRSKEVLEMVDLSGFEKKFPWHFPEDAATVSIARALTFNPDLLLMENRSVLSMKLSGPIKRTFSQTLGRNPQNCSLCYSLNS
ncbi:MAG: hypothetical protein Ct9H300mP21_03390 [Pseudomonadota bacterium]|nr:MAG: hypothetical protein Ct9H300mP21_03390 [Pseudomonadota bacterium]